MSFTALTLICVAALAVLLPSAADGGYIQNYSKWRELSHGEKLGYAMGLWDHAQLVVLPHEPIDRGTSDGLAECGKRMSPNSKMLVEAMDQHYAADSSRWDRSAVHAFYQSIVLGMCGKYVLAAREARGAKQGR